MRAETPPIRFDQLTISDGLSSNTVYTVFQGRDGMLWFGTINGLNRYDGYSIEVYRHDRSSKSSLPNNRITRIYEDRYGHLWLYDEYTAILVRFTVHEKTFYVYNLTDAKGKALEEVDAIRESSEGNLQIYSKQGIVLRYDSVSDSFVQEQEHFSPDTIAHDEVVSELGRLLELTQSKHSVQSVKVTKVIKDKDGRYWIATKFGGLFSAIRKNERLYFTDHLSTADPYQHVESEEIMDLYADRSGVVWIATKNSGLYRYTPYKYKFHHIQSVQLSSGSVAIGPVRAITQDTSGHLWVGSAERGLFRIDPSTLNGEQFLPKTDNKGALGHRFVRSLYADEGQNIWVGHYDGFSKFDPATGSFSNYRLPEKLSRDVRVYDIQDDKKGGLWMAGWDIIFRFDPVSMEFKVLPWNNGTEFDNIRDLELTPEGKLWLVAGEKGLGIYHDSDKPVLLQYAPDNPAGLPSSNVFDILKDSRNNIWLSSADGLCRFNPVDLTCETYTMNEGLPSNMIFGLLEDQKGMLWYSSTNGIGRFDPVSNTVRNFDVSDGLQSNEFTENAYFKNKDGIMFFGGINGVTMFDPARLPENLIPPQVVISSLRVYDKPLAETKSYPYHEIAQFTDTRQALELTSDQRSIAIEFAALHYVNPLKNRYAYQLTGFDKDWTYRDANIRFANYTNLESGNYVFRVRACNSDGIWSNPVELRIHIETPFYLTGWFYSSLSFALVVSGFYAYRWRIRKLKQEQSLKSIQLEAELNFLKSQVNPHFLFNTLNNIYALCQVNSRNAAPMVGKISEMMRYMIYDCNADVVPLQKEIDYLQNYIDLNQLKSNTRLNASMSVEGSTLGHKIAPLMLINFLENSFKHGDINQKGQGFVRVRIIVHEGELTYSVSNSYRERLVGESSRRGIGLQNVRHRLELLYPNKHQLKISRNHSIFEVELKLDLT